MFALSGLEWDFESYELSLFLQHIGSGCLAYLLMRTCSVVSVLAVESAPKEGGL